MPESYTAPCSRCHRPHYGVRLVIAEMVVCSDCAYRAARGEEPVPDTGARRPRVSPLQQLPGQLALGETGTGD